MTEAHIQNELWRTKHIGAQIVMPNFTPKGWFECDVWLVTKSGYVHEFEIKLTKSDFEADKLKTKNKRRRWNNPVRNKHEDLAKCHEKAPKTFTMVMPMSLAQEVEVPEFAGLVGCQPVCECLDPVYTEDYYGDLVCECGQPKWAANYLSFTELKKAPVINSKAKAPESEIKRAKIACYFRMWNDRRRS